MSKSSIFHVFLAIVAEYLLVYASVLVKVSSVPPINLGLYRMIIALPIFFIFPLYKKTFQKITLKHALYMIVAGVMFGIDILFFNVALKNTSVANVNLICSLVCFVLVPIGFFFFKEKIKINFLIGAIVAVVGIYLLVKGGSVNESSVATPFGDFMAFFSMVAYSIFLALIYGLRRSYDTLEIMFFACIGSILVLIVGTFFLEGFVNVKDISLQEWLIIFGIAIFGQVLGQTIFGFTMGKISSQTASLLLLLSPIWASFMGYFILDEALGIFEVIGIFVILLGILIVKVQK